MKIPGSICDRRYKEEVHGTERHGLSELGGGCRGGVWECLPRPIRAHVWADKVEKGCSDQRKECVGKHSF